MMLTIDVFEGGKKIFFDFHGMFDSTYFISWMQNMLDSLETINMHNAVIVTDNTKYHSSLPENTPQVSCKKQ